jgi:hypothetical protein
MKCQFQTALGDAIFHCSLGLYGGRPSGGVCRRCMGAGENNEQYAEALFARAARTHPANRPRLSGCCDRADQA